MKTHFQSGAIVLLSLVAAQAAADDAAGRFAVDGVGNRTCQQFTEALSGDRTLAVAFAGWTDGFISAANALGQETFDLTPWQTVEVILAKMKTYCTANPDDIYVDAVGKLVSTLQPTRLTEASEIVQVAWQGKAVFVYRSVLERVRDRLRELGYDVAAEPGVYEGDFVQALLDFQRDTDLPATGLPDQPTLVGLLE